MSQEFISQNNREIRLMADRIAELRKAGKPLTGPYYWVPTPYGWDITGFPEQGYGEIEHPQVWRRSIVPQLKDLWDLTDREVLDLVRCPYGVPRGRVAKGHKSDAIYILQGDDAPYPSEEATRKVSKEMALTGLLLKGLLKVEYEKHETTNPDHVASVERILEAARQRLGVGTTL